MLNQCEWSGGTREINLWEYSHLRWGGAILLTAPKYFGVNSYHSSEPLVHKESNLLPVSGKLLNLLNAKAGGK